jgi:hypothetical protein
MSPVRVVSPEGSPGPTSAHLTAIRGSLAGRRIGVLDNGKPNARLLLCTVAEQLAARTTSEVALITAKATAATPAEPEILQQLAAADLVVTGSAD